MYGAKALQDVLEEIEDQEEAIKIAEVSPLGYKLVEAYADKKIGFRFVRDKSKAVELKMIEQDILQDMAAKGSVTLPRVKFDFTYFIFHNKVTFQFIFSSSGALEMAMVRLSVAGP